MTKDGKLNTGALCRALTHQEQTVALEAIKSIALDDSLSCTHTHGAAMEDKVEGKVGATKIFGLTREKAIS